MLCARVIHFKYLSNDIQSRADLVFASLRRLNKFLRQEDAPEDVYHGVLHELANLFASPTSSVSSFELLQSGLVDGLMDFAMPKQRKGKYCPNNGLNVI